MIDFAQLQQPLPYIPVEKRYAILPEHNICSIAPAEDGSDCFITGNGPLRIRDAGRPYNNEMSFNQELLYEPLWKSAPLPPDLSKVLPEIRRLLLEGKPEEADPLLDKAQIEAGMDKYMDFSKQILYPVGSPRMHTAFWLTFKQPEQENTRDYLRWLDTQNGMISDIWTNDLGSYKTESFCAYETNVTVNRLTGPEGKLNVTVDFDKPNRPMNFRGRMFSSPFPGSSHELTQTDDMITLAWAYNPEFGQKGFVVVLRFVHEGGELTKTEKGFALKDGTSLTIVGKIVKYESDFTFECAKAVEDEMKAMVIDFDKLLAENTKRIGEKMDRSRIHLGKKEDYVLSGEELLRRTHSKTEIDPTLMDKLYDMGRFFQIYESGALPPMMGQHNINTNLQVCAGNNTGLFDEMDVYFRYYETKFDDFRTNAQRLFGARGLLCSVHCDPDSGLFYHFSRTYPHYCWTGCLGWIYNELWGYWLVSGDKKFLAERVLPAYEEMALFFEDYACDRGPDGKTIFYPSFSPEDPTPNPGYNTVTCKSIIPTRINSVMDVAIAREVLTNLIEGSKVLGINADKIAHWEKQLADLPTYLLDQEGALKEWAWPTIEENYNHRHVSHHYDVWPGRLITPETEPALTEAIIISNRKRGQQDDSAHGIIHRALTAIRLKDMEEAMQNLSQLFNHGFVRRTLQCSHFPYQGVFPDLTGAVPAFLIEMSILSMPGLLEFLPCMPDYLMEGSIDGIWLYTWAKLEHMEWNENGVKAEIVSNEDQTLTLRNRREGAQIFVNGKALAMDGDHAEYAFKKGEKALVEIKF